MTEELAPSFHDAIKREVKAALDEASIFDISSYGWLNENDPDPEFIGHAMWQTDAPYIDDAALFGERTVRRRPKEIERPRGSPEKRPCVVTAKPAIEVGRDEWFFTLSLSVCPSLFPTSRRHEFSFSPPAARTKLQDMAVM